MNDDRVVSFRPKLQPVSGSVRFPSDILCLPFVKSHYGPQWAFTAEARIDGELRSIPVHASLVADIADEPESMGWLDRGDDGFSGKFVVGADWEDIIRQAAFSSAPWDIEISFATDPEGEVLQLTLGMWRRQVEG